MPTQQPIRGIIGLIILAIYGAVVLGIAATDTINDLRSKK